MEMIIFRTGVSDSALVTQLAAETLIRTGPVGRDGTGQDSEKKRDRPRSQPAAPYRQPTAASRKSARGWHYHTGNTGSMIMLWI